MDMEVTESYEIQAQALTQEAKQYREALREVKIVTGDDYTRAGQELVSIKSRLKELDAKEKEITRPLNASLKHIRDLFRRPKDILAEGERDIKQAMLVYDREQERIRREQQAKLEEQARKERERLAARARKAEEAGKAEKAAALERQSQAVVAPVVVAPTPKAEGVSYVERWTFKIEDATKLPREYLVPDEKKIGQVVRALKGDTNIPGVRAYALREVRARTA